MLAGAADAAGCFDVRMRPTGAAYRQAKEPVPYEAEPALGICAGTQALFLGAPMFRPC